MYVENKDVSTPPDAQVIWRYLTFAKFISLLESRTLFFARADQLEDPFEGSLTFADQRQWTEKETDERSSKYFSQKRYIVDHIRQFTFINCWHMNDFESAAMWRLYLHSADGIAVRSTCARLKRAIASTNQEVIIGAVRYIDYDTEQIPPGGTNHLFFCKRRSFEHERELRALFTDVRIYPDEAARVLRVNLEEPEHEYGVPVPVNLEDLIDAVFVAPTAPRWVHQLTVALAQRYQAKFEVRQSRLNDERIR